MSLFRVSWKIEQQGKRRQDNVHLSVSSDLVNWIFASGDGGEDEIPKKHLHLLIM